MTTKLTIYRNGQPKEVEVFYNLNALNVHIFSITFNGFEMKGQFSDDELIAIELLILQKNHEIKV